MCGRYTLSSPADVLKHFLEIEEPLEPLVPRYNVAPGQDCPVVGLSPEGRRKLRLLRWGLVPAWAKEARTGFKAINARAESVAEKASFRVPFRRRRVLVPCDGFYEWKRLDSGKQPYLVRRRDRSPFVMAGIWDRWKPKTNEQEPLDTFSVITTEACAALQDLHHRMPVILPREAQENWLDPDLRDPDQLKQFLQAFPGELLDLTPVDPRVGKVKEDDPGLLDPWPPKE